MLSMSAHNVLIWVATTTRPLTPLRALHHHQAVASGTHWCCGHKRRCPVERFHHNRSRPDGLEGYCRDYRAARRPEQAQGEV